MVATSKELLGTVLKALGGVPLLQVVNYAEVVNLFDCVAFAHFVELARELNHKVMS